MFATCSYVAALRAPPGNPIEASIRKIIPEQIPEQEVGGNTTGPPMLSHMALPQAAPDFYPSSFDNPLLTYCLSGSALLTLRNRTVIAHGSASSRGPLAAGTNGAVVFA